MEYLVVLDYTNGGTDIIPAPVFDDEDDSESLDRFLEEKYGKCDIHYIVCSNININI